MRPSSAKREFQVRSLSMRGPDAGIGVHHVKPVNRTAGLACQRLREPRILEVRPDQSSYLNSIVIGFTAPPAMT